MRLKFKILFLLFLPSLVFAKGDQKSVRTLEKSLPANASNSFKLTNKYGRITINIWDKNEINAKVTITGFGRSESEAKEIAAAVVIEEGSEHGELSITTKYNPGTKSWIFGNNKNGKEYVNIDYVVYIPRKLKNVTLINNFGDVLAHELTSPTSLILNYCYFDITAADDLYGTMNYCDKGKIGKVNNTNLKINYSSFRLEAANQMTMTSNNCDYKLGNIGTLNLKSNYDDFKLERAKKITVTGNYTDLNIGHLESEGSFNVNYSDINIKTSGSDFKSLLFSGNYSDVHMGIVKNLPVKIEGSFNYGEISTGGLSMKNVHTVKKGTKVEYSGTAGDGSVTMQLKGNYSDVTLKTE
ncbi:hypothetical protein [uncultured Chitinophaga sp.]|uniref:hypothetical protein n=1 Tax=uncultured Chitinophaga sp. TaxID=339340 RepID=UPI0025F8A5E4|nr:hypothetical protein [uncultured Chitinophaga sp.]